MNCFPCFTSNKSKRSNSRKEQFHAPQEQVITRTPDVVKKPRADDPNQVDTSNIQAQNFTFRELAVATKNFRQECLMGEGGFGRVYKGTIPATGQVVAVKQLDRNGMQGSKEFLVEVLMLSLLNHENLVKLTGYCADGEQRLLVYEFMPAGSLEKRLLDRGDQAPLDWYGRMKIASSAAKGLWYLHDKANPPVIFRDLKSSNILLDNDLNGKLSDYGLAKLAGKNKMNIVPTTVMGTYGYSAPEYIRTGNLTLKSDVYSFGVVLLELITGRRAIDTTKPNEEQNLVSWAQPIFREPKRYPDMADPLLKNQFPEKDLNQVVAIAAMCLQEESAARPLMSDVVTALSFLSTSPPKDAPPPIPQAPSQKSAAGESESESEREAGSGADSSDEEGSRHPQDNGTAQHQVAASAKNHESDDASDAEYDYYENENQHKYSPQDAVETKEFYSKSSCKSSTKSRNETVPSSGHGSSDSEGGMVLSNQKSSKKHLGQKSSKKSSMREEDLSQKSSKKNSLKDRDLSQKNSKKSSMRDRDLSQKSSKKKSSVKILSHKSSTGAGSEEGSLSYRGNASLSRNGSISSSEEESQNRGGAAYEHGNASFGLISSESVCSDHDSDYRFQNGGSLKFDHNSSRGSDVHHFDRASMASSSSSEDEGSYRHLNSGASSQGR